MSTLLAILSSTVGGFLLWTCFWCLRGGCHFTHRSPFRDTHTQTSHNISASQAALGSNPPEFQHTAVYHAPPPLPVDKVRATSGYLFRCARDGFIFCIAVALPRNESSATTYVHFVNSNFPILASGHLKEVQSLYLHLVNLVSTTSLLHNPYPRYLYTVVCL